MLSITTDLCDVYFQPDEDEEVDLGELFSPRNIEVNYDFECTPLFHAIQRQNWEETAEIATEYPEQVRTWVHRYDGQNRRSLRWRMLPIHALFVFSGTHDLVVLFLFIYPESAQLTDDQRMLPLHLACRNGSEESTIEEILSAFPQALTETDYKGRTPLDLVKTSTYRHKEELLNFLIEYDGNTSSNRLAHIESALISRTIGTTEHRDNTDAAVGNQLKPKSNLFMKTVQFHPDTGGTYVTFSDALKKGPKSPRVLRIATEKKKASTLGKLEIIAKGEKKQRCFQTVVVDPIPSSRNADEDEREQPEIFNNYNMDKFVDPQKKDLYEREQPPNSTIGFKDVSDPLRSDLASESSSRLDSIDDTTISEKSTLIDKALIAFECGEQMESSVESSTQTTPSQTLSSSSSSSWSASTSESVSSAEQSSSSIRTDLTLDSKGQSKHKVRPIPESIRKKTESQGKLSIQSLREQRLQQLVQSIDDDCTHVRAENQDDGASNNDELLVNTVADSVARSTVTSIHWPPEEFLTDRTGVAEVFTAERKGNSNGTKNTAENSNSAPHADAKQEQRMPFENEAQEKTATDTGINLKIECSVGDEESKKNEDYVGTESSSVENSNSAPLAGAEQEQKMSFENEAQEETGNDSEIILNVEYSVSEEEYEKNEDFSGTEISSEYSNSAPSADAKQEQRISFENIAQERIAYDSEINLKIECIVSEEESDKIEALSKTNSSENIPTYTESIVCNEWNISKRVNEDGSLEHDERLKFDVAEGICASHIVVTKNDETSNTSEHVFISEEIEASPESGFDGSEGVVCIVSEEESDKIEALSKSNSSENIPTYNASIVCNEWNISQRVNEDGSLEHDERLKFDVAEGICASHIVVTKNDETSNTSEHVFISEEIEASPESGFDGSEGVVCIVSEEESDKIEALSKSNSSENIPTYNASIVCNEWNISQRVNEDGSLEHDERLKFDVAEGIFASHIVVTRNDETSNTSEHVFISEEIEASPESGFDVSEGVDEILREKTIFELEQSRGCDLKEEADEKPDEDIKHAAHDDVKHGGDKTLQLSVADGSEKKSCDKQCQIQSEDTTPKRDFERIGSSEFVPVQISSKKLFLADENEKNVAEESLTALNPHIDVSVEDLKNSDVKKAPCSFDIDDQIESVRLASNETLKEDDDDFHFIDLSCHVIHLSDSDKHEAMQVKGCSDSSPVSEIQATKRDICCSAGVEQMEEKRLNADVILIARKDEKEQESKRKINPVAISKNPEGHKWKGNDPVPSYARFRTTKTIVNSRMNFPVVVNTNPKEKEKVRKDNVEYKKPSMRLRASWVVPSSD